MSKSGLDKQGLNIYYAPMLSNQQVTHYRPAGCRIFKEEMNMSIGRYDPFRDLRSLQDEVNRLFSTNLSRTYDDEGIARGAWNPSVDIYENKDQIVLEAELPGMKREDFDLAIENNVITLRGERRFEKKDEGDNYHRVERSYGSFTRSFTLPQTVQSENVAAEYRNGVLRVKMPKREEVKVRRIEIAGDVAEAKGAHTIEAKAENVMTDPEKTKRASAS